MKISSIVHNPMERVSINMQLRSYFIQVYRFMFLGLLMSAACAWFGAQPFMVAKLYSLGENGHTTLSPFGWIVCLAPFILVFKLHADAHALKTRAATITFYLFAALMGLSLSSIFLVYAPGTIFTTFLISATVFGLLSLYGQTTQKDLSSINSQKYGCSYALFFINASASSLLVFVLSNHIPSTNFSTVVSKGSLLILGIHMPLIKILTVLLPLYFLYLTPIIVMLLCYYPIKWLDIWCPPLLGKLK